MVDTGDTSYQLYRVEAAFTGDFNFRDFPFDAHGGGLSVGLADRIRGGCRCPREVGAVAGRRG